MICNEAALRIIQNDESMGSLMHGDIEILQPSASDLQAANSNVTLRSGGSMGGQTPGLELQQVTESTVRSCRQPQDCNSHKQQCQTQESRQLIASNLRDA